jgi:lipopolysaccharide transport system permease protein
MSKLSTSFMSEESTTFIETGTLPDAPALTSELTIEAGRAERQYWRDLWRYRELFYFLAWRDILVRYKQTVIGISWAVIRPLLTMAVLTFVFSYIAKMDSGKYPYPILIFCAMLPWQFFATAFSESGNSLVANAGMISKVYFPRLVVPVSSVITSFVDFLISAVLLAGMMVIYRYVPGPTILFLPLFVLLAFATAFGAGLWISALMVRYRDFKYIVPFVVQFGLYLSPVGYLSSRVPSEWRLLYSLNPMVGVIDGFRWSILGQSDIYWPGLYISIGTVALLIASGVWYFRKTERTFADVI